MHLLEPHWNPLAEEQAIARVHRIGQQRQVTATKYITTDSIEEVSDIPPPLSVNPVGIKHSLTPSASMFKAFKLRNYGLFGIHGVPMTDLLAPVLTVRLQGYVGSREGKETLD